MIDHLVGFINERVECSYLSSALSMSVEEVLFDKQGGGGREIT